jgi:hypothetical protein
MISCRRGGRVVRQRPAKPRTPVRIRSAPLVLAKSDADCLGAPGQLVFFAIVAVIVGIVAAIMSPGARRSSTSCGPQNV